MSKPWILWRDTLLLWDGCLAWIEERLLETGESEALSVAAAKDETTIDDVGTDALSASSSPAPQLPAAVPQSPRSFSERRGQGMRAPRLVSMGRKPKQRDARRVFFCLLNAKFFWFTLFFPFTLHSEKKK